jgi:hypothetical protein
LKRWAILLPEILLIPSPIRGRIGWGLFIFDKVYLLMIIKSKVEVSI